MIRVLLTVLVALAGAGPVCGQTPQREPMRGVKRGDKQVSLPTLIVGINAAIGTIAEPGWPLIVTATVSSDGKSPTPPLPANLGVQVTNENGARVALTFEPLSPPAISLAASGLTWVTAESATTQLAPGRYHVSVVSPTGVPAGWSVESGEIRVLAPAPERAGRLSRLKIHLSILRGRDDDALAEAERAVGANPRDSQAWIAKGDLLMQKDEPDQALEAYDRALNLHRGDKMQPYSILRLRHAAHLRSLEKRGVIAPAAPR